MELHIHIHKHYSQKQLKKIMESLQQVKDALIAAKADSAASKEIIVKISADVDLLHTKIDALPEVPTAEEIAELKTLSTDLQTSSAELKASLQGVDDKTAEETTGDTGGDTSGGDTGGEVDAENTGAVTEGQ